MKYIVFLIFVITGHSFAYGQTCEDGYCSYPVRGESNSPDGDGTDKTVVRYILARPECANDKSIYAHLSHIQITNLGNANFWDFEVSGIDSEGASVTLELTYQYSSNQGSFGGGGGSAQISCTVEN